MSILNGLSNYFIEKIRVDKLQTNKYKSYKIDK